MTSEKISFERVTTTDDGEGGTTGTTGEVYACLAEVKTLKPSRLLEANQTSLRQGYLFLIMITKLFEPQTGDTVVYRDERLTIQGYRYTDETRRRYEITALEGITGANGTVSN